MPPHSASPAEAAARLGDALASFPVIGIVRGCPSAHLESVVESAARAGLRVIEITLDSPEPLRGIASITTLLPDLVVGAGTARSPEDVRAAVDAGAGFIVSPDTNERTLDQCRTAGLPAIPGAATPTEITRAVDLGAYAVKVFPAAPLGGPAFIRAVVGPLGRPRLVPTGGVSIADAADYLEAGALAVGIGGSVFRRTVLETGDGSAVRAPIAQLHKSLS